ncbi:hypothetical protein NPIL_54091 [Nephila pilipes]|uniref:Uncharacterized protein n=1 Tax=Nephila pilipes TaxID=299642 RepID=A0A8X6NWH5_NEPPI|nr:hypothetical protein NPIL_54091 [Nephila pilipes]
MSSELNMDVQGQAGSNISRVLYTLEDPRMAIDRNKSTDITWMVLKQVDNFIDDLSTFEYKSDEHRNQIRVDMQDPRT